MLSRNVALALSLYDSRREFGIPEGRALYSTAAGFAATVGMTREQARRVLVAALKDRAQIGTRGPVGAL